MLMWSPRADFLGVVVRTAASVAHLTLTVGSAEPTELQLYPVPHCRSLSPRLHVPREPNAREDWTVG
jgi:hypothetical protein